MIDGFLAHVSHEMRNPLNAIIGLAELEIRKNETPDNIKQTFVEIQKAGRMLLNIVNDLLNCSAAGELNLKLKRYSIHSLVDDVVTIIADRYRHKPVKLSIDIRDDMPKWLVGDELRIKQILGNILSNAFKYTETGNITVEVSHIRADKPKHTTLTISIADTGHGMTPEQTEKLFSEYVRFNSEVEGFGLGLVITKQMLELMGGDISVDSEYGKGSEFVISIPQTIAE